jgi:arabinogalactan endo-1,4-beta-galactosidase
MQRSDTPKTPDARRRALLLLPLVSAAGVVAGGAGAQTSRVEPGNPCRFILGADVSSLLAVERGGGRFQTASGEPSSALQLLRDAGMGWARLRLWHTPINARDVIEGGRVVSRQGEAVGGGDNGIETTLALARRLRSQGFKYLLDIHYSDHWADPGKQHKPAAWAALEGPALEMAVHRYTTDVLARLAQQGTPPQMVQIGNEINGGMLWPSGKTWRERADERIGGEAAFHALLSAGIRAVREFDRARGSHTPVMLHVAFSGDGKAREMLERVYGGFEAGGLDYDLIGLSWYPFFHESIRGLRDTLAVLGQRFGKPLILVETSFAWRIDNPGGAPGIFNEGHAKKADWPATPAGQAQFMRDVIAAVASVPQGLGVFWWEPAWLAVPEAGWRTGDGNGWANQTLFDVDGRPLPALSGLRAALPSACRPGS